jgi:tetratricopeptide (TPR) repeat protein
MVLSHLWGMLRRLLPAAPSQRPASGAGTIPSPHTPSGLSPNIPERVNSIHPSVQYVEPDFDASLDYALSAYSEQNWPEAIRRFTELRARFPGNITGYRYVGDLLFGQGHYDEADVALREAMARFPDEPALAVSYAWAAHLKADQTGEWSEASNRWRHLANVFPNNPLGPTMLGFVLMRYLGQLDEAEAILTDGMRRFPNDMDVATQHARVADFRQDWPEAMRRWDALGTRWPTAQAVLEGRGETEARLRFSEIENADFAPPQTPSLEPVPQTEAEIERNLFMRFESLGENCEFGLAQRHFGAEPLGLLRWMASTPDQLCLALENEFEGFDDRENFEVKLSGPEYFLYEKRYQMEMHTFILKSEYQGTLEQLQDQLSRRMRYLKRKFLDDLRAAEKVLVWQTGMGSSLSDETVSRMHRAIRSFGNNTLMVIRRHNDPSQVPNVQLRQPGLLVGSIHQVELDGDERMSSPFQAWQAVCRAALQLCTGSL